ncbi:globoside alpha-1,3-N-acetylgalactosaminyltransferase 1 isoform X2 [Trachypithecus francoisi]|uniref:globoside alpha-1,3-N-acetylgalactosaminyltransferase 1 isoform X2 n=1 Tax=Trachypithecus francoisi TaxID=54180 RepID=UPI00141B8BCF|nr:globoside alpha-1,3-N-acetylgalactosaminyltransferase 1 isoform X2 [Trachypithecus francoisi]
MASSAQTGGVSAGAQALVQPPAMHRQRLALGLGFCLLAGTSLSVLWLYAENWLPVSYVPYYLPCPEIFNMKLHCKREKPLQPVTWSQYPQSKLLEHRYTDFIQSFLESAEEFFMRGYQVHYYIFTDNPAAVPGVPLGPRRLLSTIPIQGHSNWEEISMRRMETISQHIAKRAHREVDYLFCLDVDMVFRNPWGPETLGDLVAAIHPSYYATPRQQFPYEHRRVSTAFVADSEGDFYYGGKVFGGQVARVYEFTRGCHMALLADKANGIMAAWREESHLNRRFISSRPRCCPPSTSGMTGSPSRPA